VREKQPGPPVVDAAQESYARERDMGWRRYDHGVVDLASELHMYCTGSCFEMSEADFRAKTAWLRWRTTSEWVRVDHCASIERIEAEIAILTFALAVVREAEQRVRYMAATP
jgi:hypothetical protein